MSVIFAGMTFFIMNYVIIFIIWGFAGDGAYPKTWDIYINILYILSAIIFLFPIIWFRIYVNYKKGNLTKVKDYLIVCVIVIVVSTFLSVNQMT